jgi:hypothetical protein
MTKIGFGNSVWKKAGRAALLLSMILVSSGLAQSDGDYILEWSTIDGGGGVNAGGQYVLEGTIGQPDAAYSAGGPYEVLGGFWPGGPECLVNFRHFARFAEYWLQTGTGLPADLYKDQYNIVDWLDLDVFVEDWLYYCPYDWPLR